MTIRKSRFLESCAVLAAAVLVTTNPVWAQEIDSSTSDPGVSTEVPLDNDNTTAFEDFTEEPSTAEPLPMDPGGFDPGLPENDPALDPDPGWVSGDPESDPWGDPGSDDWELGPGPAVDPGPEGPVDGIEGWEVTTDDGAGDSERDVMVSAGADTPPTEGGRLPRPPKSEVNDWLKQQLEEELRGAGPSRESVQDALDRFAREGDPAKGEPVLVAGVIDDVGRYVRDMGRGVAGVFTPEGREALADSAGGTYGALVGRNDPIPGDEVGTRVAQGAGIVGGAAAVTAGAIVAAPAAGAAATTAGTAVKAKGLELGLTAAMMANGAATTIQTGIPKFAPRSGAVARGLQEAARRAPDAEVIRRIGETIGGR